MRAGEPDSCAYRHPKYISPQGVSGAAPNNINRKQQSGHVCDSSLWLTNHIVCDTSFIVLISFKKAPFSRSQPPGKWCATFSVSAWRSVRGAMCGRAALSPGEERCAPKAVPTKASIRLLVITTSHLMSFSLHPQTFDFLWLCCEFILLLNTCYVFPFYYSQALLSPFKCTDLSLNERTKQTPAQRHLTVGRKTLSREHIPTNEANPESQEEGPAHVEMRILDASFPRLYIKY